MKDKLMLAGSNDSTDHPQSERDKMNTRSAQRIRQHVLGEIIEALEANDGIGSSQEAVAIVEALR